MDLAVIRNGRVGDDGHAWDGDTGTRCFTSDSLTPKSVTSSAESIHDVAQLLEHASCDNVHTHDLNES